MTRATVHSAVLLAAGRGTRLGHLTERFPKPMLEVGGRPIIGHILAGLADGGVGEVSIITGHCAEILERGIGDGAAYGVEVRYVRQPRPDGTARAVSLARDRLEGAPFFFGWGDILVSPANYRRVLEAASSSDAVLAVNRVDDPCAGAAVYVDEQRHVTRMVEKPSPGTSTTNWNNAGLGVLPPDIWPYVDALRPSPRGEHELPQAIAAMVDQGARVTAVPVEGQWFDIGTPEDLELARARWSS